MPCKRDQCDPRPGFDTPFLLRQNRRFRSGRRVRHGNFYMCKQKAVSKSMTLRSDMEFGYTSQHTLMTSLTSGHDLGAVLNSPFLLCINTITGSLFAVSNPSRGFDTRAESQCKRGKTYDMCAEVYIHKKRRLTKGIILHYPSN